MKLHTLSLINILPARTMDAVPEPYCSSTKANRGKHAIQYLKLRIKLKKNANEPHKREGNLSK
jgi:hypothetical protein